MALALETELDALAAEIQRLDAEIMPLQVAHDDLYKKVAQFEADNKHKHLTKPLAPRRVSPHPDEPPLIYYEYFDDSIRHYFSQDAPPEPLAPSVQNVLHQVDTRLSGAQNALLELVWRLGGVSAFPINNRLYDDSTDALLGLRFDILSHRTLRYLQPHYIILRRRADKSDNSFWLVFRYTTPVYVPLAKYALFLAEDRLWHFVDLVRAYLVKTQYKHDKFDALAAITYADVFGLGLQRLISAMEKDLECRRIVLRIDSNSINDNGRKQLHVIELVCGVAAIEKVTCRFGEQNQRLHIETELASCGLTNLERGFGVVAKYMRQHDLL